MRCICEICTNMSCFTVRLLLKIYKNNVPVQCAACMFVTGHINISQNFNVYGTWSGCLQQTSYLYGTQPWTAPIVTCKCMALILKGFRNHIL